MSPIRSHQVPAAALPRGGVDKPRGVENAALQHQRKQLGKAAAAPAAAPPAAVVSFGAGVEAVTYTREGRWSATPYAASVPSAQNGGSPAPPPIEAEISGAGTVSVGEGSNVHINTRAESGGGGTLSVGEGSNVHINARGSGGGGGQLIVGDDANVHINARGSGGGGGQLIVADDANVHIQTRGPGGDASAASAKPFSASAYRSDGSDEIDHRIEADRNAAGARDSASYRNAVAARPSVATPEQDGPLGGTRAGARRAQGTAAAAPLDPRLQMFKELVDSVRQPAASKTDDHPADPARVKKAKGIKESEDAKAQEARAPGEAKVKDAKEAGDAKAAVAGTEGEPARQRQARAVSTGSRARG